MKVSKGLKVVVATVVFGVSLGVISAVSSYADPEPLGPNTAIAVPSSSPLIWAHGGGGRGGIGGIYLQ